MLLKNDRVRHIDPVKDQELGVLTIFEIKNGFAICGYYDYSRMHLGPWTFKLEELRKAE